MENINARVLGLNKYEFLVYQALIKLGKSTASEISKISNVPYGRIYDVLYSLESKGYVKTVTDKIKRFIASDPESILALINDKKKELDLLEEEFEKLDQIYITKEEEPVTIVKGNRNFHKVIKEKPEAKDYRYTIKYKASPNPNWVKGYKTKLKKGIDIKNMVRLDKETENNVKKWGKVLPELKAIDNEGVLMSIIDDHYVLIGLITANTTIVIKNEAFCKIMKQLYEAKYKGAEKIVA